MATLVLSSVGSMLGGPVGGAIGGLVGQSIDQQVFAPASRGPRLGDLAVQTSSYGTQIPRIYGTMRVAGSVIWSTDLTQSTQLSGVKGQPDETYSYSVSFAVALSSRPLLQIRRIWADGKLLRGEEGDFKVPTGFRFYDGRETQTVDPLIASVEGIDGAPAYRGLALAVFEGLELAEYGNRIPFLTFEVVADEAATVGDVLGDAGGGAIRCDSAAAIGGYAASGSSIAGAIEPIVDAFSIDLAETGLTLNSPPVAQPIAIAQEYLGCSADAEKGARIEREQTSARSLPSSVLLSYYESERDYQTGQARSDPVDQSPHEQKIELPAVIPASSARALSEQILAKRWAQRDKLILRLPPEFMTLQPGSVIEVPRSTTLWQVARSTIDGMVSILELHPTWHAQAAIDAEAGRAIPAPDIVIDDLSLALVELPDIAGRAGQTPTVYLAATTPASGWKRLPAEISASGFLIGTRTAARKAIMGSAQTVLADGPVDVIDDLSAVEVELIDPAQWLTSCDDEAIAAGANLALIGDELLQFADAEAIAPGRFRLTGMSRGRYATDWATSGHASGDLFLMIDPLSVQSIALPASARGMVVSASCQGANATCLVDGRSLRTGLFVDGEQVVGTRAEAIASPAGGATVDAEARTAVSQILAALRTHGLIDT